MMASVGFRDGIVRAYAIGLKGARERRRDFAWFLPSIKFYEVSAVMVETVEINELRV